MIIITQRTRLLGLAGALGLATAAGLQGGPILQAQHNRPIVPSRDNYPPELLAPIPQLPPQHTSRHMRDLSWTFIDSPKPKKLNVHDIITVIVDEKSEVTQDSLYNRQRNAVLKAQLKQFIRINEDFNLDTAAENSPTIDSQLRSQLNTQGQAKSREGMRYRIAATVTEVLPNGTIVLEARKMIRTNKDLWEYTLTGRIRAEDINGNNTVLSENIAEMNITKQEQGKIRDSSKRGWFTRLYDFLLPF